MTGKSRTDIVAREILSSLRPTMQRSASNKSTPIARANSIRKGFDPMAQIPDEESSTDEEDMSPRRSAALKLGRGARRQILINVSKRNLL